MSESYNIKIAVDSRAGSRGVKNFSAALNESLKSLRDFDRKAKATLKALEDFGNIKTAGLKKASRDISAAVNELNKIKINKQLVSNLQSLQRALAGLRFSGANSIKKIPDAFNAINGLRINPAIAQQLNELKAAMKGFRGPPKSMAGWANAFTGIDKIKINPSVPKRIAELNAAMKGFRGPSKSAFTTPSFLRQLGYAKINSNLAPQVMALKNAFAGFRGPSQAAGKNFQSLIHAMQSADPSKIAAIVNQLSRLNGLNFNMRFGGGRNPFAGYQSGAIGATNALRGLQVQMSATHHVAAMLQTAMGGFTFGTFISGVYETGSSWLSLQRSLGAVATSMDEVGMHIDFLNELTTKMPISLDSAIKSYGKFAVAARLSGMSVQDTQNIFESFSMGFSAMGMTPEAQKYAFLALEQMISKGTIQMEELRRQLGDHLPGAVQILADSMGVSTSKLIDMIVAGEVGAERLIGMADEVRARFEKASEAAMMSSRGQLTQLQSQWDRFKKTVFDSGFDSGLGTMAKQLREALASPQMMSTAKSIGEAFNTAFRAVGALAQVMANNTDTVKTFLTLFAGYAAIISTATAFRLLVAPLLLLGPVARGAGAGMSILASAIGVIASGRALSAVTNFFKASTLKIVGMTLAVAGLVWMLDAFLQLIDNVAGTSMGGNIDKIFEGIGSAAEALTERLGNLDLFGGLMDEFQKAMDAGGQIDMQIRNANLIDAENVANNAVREQTQKDIAAKTLSKEAQSLWEQINPIGAANEEYQKQLKHLEEIGKKLGLNKQQLEEYKAILAAQTLEDRNPLGAAVQDMEKELRNARAKTAEQRAVNAALDKQNELLKQGVVLSQEQVGAIADYHRGIAMMNGELGNGIERWTASVGDFNDNLQNAIKDGIGGLSDEITNFVTGAEADFRGLAQSILRTFVKLALDSLLKDLFKSMGLDGEEKGANMAETALSKLASMGESITTAHTSVYTGTLSVNGQPLGGPFNGMKGSPEVPSQRGPFPPAPGTGAPRDNDITRSTLPDIPGTNVDRTWERHIAKQTEAIETVVKPLKNGMVGSPELPSAAARPGSGLMNSGPVTTPKGDRLMPGFPSAPATPSMPHPDRFAPGVTPFNLPMNAPLPTARPNMGAGALESMMTGGLGNGGAPSRFSFNKFSDASYQQISNELMDRLKADFGLSDNQAGGIVANLAHESAGFRKLQEMQPLVPGSRGGYGIAQWTGPRRREYEAFAKQGGFATDSPEAQYQFLKKELMGSENASLRHLQQQTSLRDSTVSFQDKFERPGIPHTASRLQHADRIMNNYQPGAAGMAGAQPGIDPMATSSITQMNTALQQTGQAAQSAVPQIQQMSTQVQQTGTTAMTSGQQQQSANQMKAMSEQTSAMQTQMAGQSVMMAGQNASMASPQFQQAGQSMMMAGQQAQMAGASAATAQGGLGGFGQGIMGLLGPLASAIPGLGQFGGMIMQLIQQLMMSSTMSAVGGGLFSEGGYATAPVTRAMVPSAAFANAPHYAEGTPNTSGGMPAILHPNEAVIPLSRGRKIPVELGDSGEPRQENLDKRQRPVMVMNIHGVKDADGFKRTKSQIASSLQSMQQRANLRNG